MHSLKKDKFIDLKVHINKNNGQGVVNIPKKKMGVMPKKVRILWPR